MASGLRVERLWAAEDAKPYLDQIASDEICEGKLKDYVRDLSRNGWRMAGPRFMPRSLSLSLPLPLPLSPSLPLSSLPRLPRSLAPSLPFPLCFACLLACTTSGEGS